MPLPKRGPHLRKRPPSPRPPRPRALRRHELSRAGAARRRSAGAAGSRSAGRGGHQPRPERVSVPRGLGRRHRRQGPAAAHSRPTTRRPDRTEPIEPAPTPDPAFSLPSLLPIPRPPYPRLTPRRTDGRPTRLKSDTNPPVTPALPVAAAPPPAHQHPPGLTRPTFTWQVEEGGSGAKRRTPLPPKAQAGSRGNTRGRGGGLLRSGPKPIERNRWSETQGGKQVSRPLQLRFIPRRSL